MTRPMELIPEWGDNDKLGKPFHCALGYLPSCPQGLFSFALLRAKERLPQANELRLLGSGQRVNWVFIIPDVG